MKLRYLALFFILFSFTSQADLVERITLNPSRIDSNGASFAPSISADGRYIAFHSSANNLDFSDTNRFVDVYLYDRHLQNIQRVSLSSDGSEGDFISQFPAVAADGRFIAFQSDASNLVPNDTNRTTDIFVRDLVTAETVRVSVSSTGQEGNLPAMAPAISGDGRYVVFHSEASNLVSGDRNNLFDIFLHDRDTNTTQLISTETDGSATDGFSFNPLLSHDGRYIVYTSEATGLVADDNNGMADIFLYDQETASTRRVSVDAAGNEADNDSLSPAISAEGRYIAFASRATNLVPNDNNAVADIFVYDRQTATIERVSVSSSGAESNEAATNPAISGNGRYVAFNSAATNLVAEDNNTAIDVFVHDRATGQTRLLSVQQQQSSPEAASFFRPALSENGRWIAFESRMASLVSNDFNRVTDVFLYDQTYAATFNMLTTILRIPALTTSDGFHYTAELALLQDAPLQFEVTQLLPVEAGLAAVPTRFTATTLLLEMDTIEVLQPDGQREQYRARLQLDAEAFPYRLEVTELERAE